MELVDLFPKTIAVAQLQSLTPVLMQRAIELIEFSGSIDRGHDGTYTQEQQLLDKVLFREVKEEILGLCREFSKVYSHKVEDIAICNSWGNVIRQGQTIHYHRHDNSYISGSFYLTEGSPLNILNTVHRDLFGFVPQVEDKENFRSWESFNIKPKPGRIILFPSMMHHCVLPSDSPDNRYSIAFNAIPLGKVGGPTGLLNIRLA